MPFQKLSSALSSAWSSSTLHRYIFSIPEAIMMKDYRFFLVANVSYHIAFVTHVAWVLLFLVTGVVPLVLASVVSALFYIGLILINRHGHFKLTTTLGILEIIFHQILFAYLIGYEAGFTVYILVISIYPFLMPAWGGLYKGFLFLGMILGYLFIELIVRWQPPLYMLQEDVLTGLRLSNTGFAYIILALMAAYFHLAVSQTEQQLEEEHDKSEKLLLNILPQKIADEIKDTGQTVASLFEEVTVMFTDIRQFTQFSEKLTPAEVVAEVDYMFKGFDHITGKYNIEKIKTIGDSYMCASGIPEPSKTHAIDMVKAALEINQFIRARGIQLQREGRTPYEIRIGIHSGPVVAGVVGAKKFAYDIWGDTVNIASRMESSGKVGRINISAATFQLVRDHFTSVSRGKIEAKHKGEVEMYFVEEG